MGTGSSSRFARCSVHAGRLDVVDVRFGPDPDLVVLIILDLVAFCQCRPTRLGS